MLAGEDVAGAWPYTCRMVYRLQIYCVMLRWMKFAVLQLLAQTQLFKCLQRGALSLYVQAFQLQVTPSLRPAHSGP